MEPLQSSLGATSFATTAVAACALPLGLMPRNGGALLFRSLRQFTSLGEPTLGFTRRLATSAPSTAVTNATGTGTTAASLAARTSAPLAASAPPRTSLLLNGGGLLRAGLRGTRTPGVLLSAPLRSSLVVRSYGQVGVRHMATQASSASASSRSPLLTRFRGRLGEALRLHVAAAWQSYGSVAYGIAAVTAVYVTWRVMRGVTNMFIAVNDKMAEYGIMAVAALAVLLGAAYLRWRSAVNPGAVYRQAMVRLNTAPGVLEVMGAPLVGSPVRAYVVTGGGLYLSKSFRVKLRSRRIQMLFPLSGSERKGLVSLEAKRKAGKYAWKLLAVDLGPELQQALPAGGAPALSAAPLPPPPPPSQQQQGQGQQQGGGLVLQQGQQQRVYVVGDVAAYQRSGVLGELRAPFLKALSNSRSYEVEDELEDELDELRVPRDGANSVQSSSAASAAAAVQRVRAALTSVLATSGGGGGAGGGGSKEAAAAAEAAAATKAAPPSASVSPTATSPPRPPTPPGPPSSPEPLVTVTSTGAGPGPGSTTAAAPPPLPPSLSSPSGASAAETAKAPQPAAAATAAAAAGGESFWSRMRTLLSGPSPPPPPPGASS